MTRSKPGSAKWDAVKDEIRSILIETAKARQTITYSELCLRLTTVSWHHRSTQFHQKLREVCAEEWDNGNGNLCALVVRKDTGIPGGGYFSDMEGMPTDDLEAVWRQDLEELFKLWSER